MEADNKMIKTKSTSLKSAELEGIILRETSTTRLLFKPMLVENRHNEDACVRGEFVFQKKNQKGHFVDYKDLSLSNLRAEEWIKLELKAGEIHKLFQHISSYYELYSQYGVPSGNKEFKLIDKNISKVLEIFDDEDNMKKLLKYGDSKLLMTFMKSLAKTDDFVQIAAKLSNLTAQDLTQINSIIGIANMKKMLSLWQENQENQNEEFWQRTFKNNPWLLSQCFSIPTVIINDKAYVGGKNIANKSGHIIDFLYKNNLTDNIALIEIKTPITQILGANYRGGVFSLSHELSGSVNQILAYKDSLQKHFFTLFQGAKDVPKSFNPKCIIIIGKSKSLEKEDKISSFELFRAELKDVEVITFDEVFSKLESILAILEQ